MTSTIEERRWALALERAIFGVWDLDPLRDQVHYSPAWKAHLGFPRIGSADASAFWRCRVHPEDMDLMLSTLRAHLDGDAATYEMRFRLRSNGLGYRTVLSRGRVVSRDAHGGATRMVGTMLDLTGVSRRIAQAGLPAEFAPAPDTGSRRPLHAILGVGRAAGDAAGAAPGLLPSEIEVVEQVHDLLDMALRDGEPTRV